MDSNQKPPGLPGGVHRVERAVPPPSPHRPKTAIRELRASDSSPLGGRRCLDVAISGTTTAQRNVGRALLEGHSRLEPTASRVPRVLPKVLPSYFVDTARRITRHAPLNLVNCLDRFGSPSGTLFEPPRPTRQPTQGRDCGAGSNARGLRHAPICRRADGAEGRAARRVTVWHAEYALFEPPGRARLRRQRNGRACEPPTR